MNNGLTSEDLKIFFDLVTRANSEQVSKLEDYLMLERKKRDINSLDDRQNNLSAELLLRK